MSLPITNELLYSIFAGTLSADKGVRESAEHALNELSNQHQDLVLHLLRFSCEAIPSENDGPVGGFLSAREGVTNVAQAEQRNVLLAAAIRVRNVLGRSDWNRNPYFTEAVKLEVRQLLVPMQCQPHVSERVRRQLLETTKELMVYDYPDRWPGLIPQLNNLFDGWMASLRSALNATGQNSSSDPVASVVLQLRGGLGVLRACCKVYEDPLRVDASAVDRFANLFMSPLISLSELFFGLWRDEMHRLWKQLCRQQTMDLPGLGNLFEFTPILTELSHCLRLVLKCNWSLLTARMPKCLCDEEFFQNFWQTCYAKPLSVIHEAYLPMCRARLQTPSPITGHGNDQDALGDHFSVFQESAMWKYVKWIYQTAYKLTQEFIEPKSCERRVRVVAKGFRDVYLSSVVQCALQLVRWHSCPASSSSSPSPMDNGNNGSANPSDGSSGGQLILLTSKAYIMALEILSSAVSDGDVYASTLHPAAEELMTGLLFPRLSFSYEDDELWRFNPEEYVRKQSNPVGDLFSAKVVSASCLLSLAVPAAPHQDTALLGSLVNFLMNQLQFFSAPASQAVSEEQSSPAAMEAARRVDAALFCMFQFKKVLSEMQLGDDKLEFVLTSFVVPATRYPLGFLRARAVLVLSVFAPSIQWSSPAAYQSALQSVLPLLNDPETPVRVQTCVSFSRLIRHPYARDVVTPCIAQLIQHYFDVMRLMDNEAVIRTLRKTITYYHDSLSQWGLELTDMLVSHFQTVLQNVSVKYSALESAGTDGPNGGAKMSDCLEDDGFADVLMAADELLDTLTTLVKALPAATENTPDNIFAQLQYRISPMLYVILSHQGGSTYGFMDPILMLLTTLLSRSPRVVEPTWRLVPCLYQLILTGGAVDYFGQMLAPLDNYVSVAPQQFLFLPLGELCGADVAPFAGIPQEMLHKTPMQLVQEMASKVLQSSNSLRGREIGSVPKLYDSMMQNIWVIRKTLTEGDPQQQQQQQHPQVSGTAVVAPPAGAAEAVVSSTAQQLVYYLGTGPLSQAAGSSSNNSGGGGAGRRKPAVSVGTGSLRVLFANAIFSCVIAEPASALQTLASFNAIDSFYELYVATVLGARGQGSGERPSRNTKRAVDEALLSHLRSYDRNVFLLSFCESIQLLSRTAWTPTHDTLVATLAAVVQTSLLETFAREEKSVSEREAAYLEKRAQSMQRKLAKAAGNRVAGQLPQQGQAPDAGDAGEEDDDDENWEDDDSSCDDDEDCGAYGGCGQDFDDAEEEWEDEEDEEGLDSDDAGGNDAPGFGTNQQDGAAGFGFGSEEAYFTQDRKMQALLKEAQTLRQGKKSKANNNNNGNSAGGAEDEVFEDVDDDGDDGQDVENLLDNDDNLLDEEDDDFVSPVDAVNAWGVLLDEIVCPYTQQQQPLPPPVAALVDAVVLHNQANVFQQVREVVDRVMAARLAVAGLSDGR